MNSSIQKLSTFFFVRHTGSVLFWVAAIIGCISFREYGLAWDENAQWQLGTITWNYVFNGDAFLLSVGEADHGVSFELALVAIEKIMGLKDTRDIFMMRHLVSHLFFLLGALYCYKLIDLLYKNKWLAAIGFSVFILHPHLYAHSFFNTKDVPFLTLCMICFYLTAKLLGNKTNSNAVALGICMGLLINLRLMGVLLLACTLLMMCLDALREKTWRLSFRLVAVMLGVSILAMYATWPYLWTDPVTRFLHNFKNMSHFYWPMENLFMGKQVLASEIGWKYIPVWFSVTTPVPYLVAGTFGVFCIIRSGIKAPAAYIGSLQGKMNSIFLICFILPVLTVILLKSVLYDGWRHLFFIYPAFVLLIVAWLQEIFSRYKVRVLAVSAAGLVYIASVMISYAPFQHVYFNAFAAWNKEPEYLRKQYDLDYWGTAYRKSLEYVLQNDISPVIKVYVETDPGHYNLKLLSPRDRERIAIVPQEEATYLITGYRWHPQDYSFEDKKVFAVKVADNTINAVYKLR